MPFASIKATPTQVEPGQEITVTGSQFRPTIPVILRLDTLDGPELARVNVDSPKGPFFRATIVLPENISPGDHVLVATQDAADWTTPPWGVPARTVIRVGQGPSPAQAAPPPAAPRTADLNRESVSAASVVLVGVGVAAAAMAAFGGIALVVSRRVRTPEPARVVS